MSYKELLDILRNIKKQEFYKDTGKMVKLCSLMDDIIYEYPIKIHKEKYQTTIEFEDFQNGGTIIHIDIYNKEKDALSQLKYYHDMWCDNSYHCKKDMFDCCDENDIFERFYYESIH